MKIAVVGCCHGELDAIYRLIDLIEKRHEQSRIELLLICGDFQAVRNQKDLESLASPAKYSEMKQFWKYYSDQAKAPLLTIVIGGNHECSNYMSELPYGGWLAPNIYYMGKANVLSYRGLRVAGISGIYNNSDYMRGHYECPPFDRNSVRSVYHTRNLEVFRLMQLRDGRPVDIFLSHDWPRGITWCGDQNGLLSRKPFLSNDIHNDRLGNPHTAELLHALRPKYWLAGHHHCKFAARVQHSGGAITNFLALDKCQPGRDFFQVLDVEPQNEPLFGDGLCLDPEWLCILKSTDHLLSVSAGNVYMPGPNRRERYDFKPSREELQTVIEDFKGLFEVPSAENTFVRTAPPSRRADPRRFAPYCAFKNPQTDLLCQMLDIRDPIEVLYRQMNRQMQQPEELEEGEVVDDDDDDNGGTVEHGPATAAAEKINEVARLPQPLPDTRGRRRLARRRGRGRFASYPYPTNNRSAIHGGGIRAKV